MAIHPTIFAERRATPGQLRAVSELRLGDARSLFDSRVNSRMNGAMYTGGFVIECLLKALLLERHRNLSGPVDLGKLSKPDREVHEMLYRHDLDDMLDFLPEIRTKLEKIKSTRGTTQWQDLFDVCSEWTIYARYSSKLANRRDAEQFLNTIEEIKEWPRQQ